MLRRWRFWSRTGRSRANKTPCSRRDPDRARATPRIAFERRSPPEAECSPRANWSPRRRRRYKVLARCACRRRASRRRLPTSTTRRSPNTSKPPRAPSRVCFDVCECSSARVLNLRRRAPSSRRRLSPVRRTCRRPKRRRFHRSSSFPSSTDAKTATVEQSSRRRAPRIRRRRPRSVAFPAASL